MTTPLGSTTATTPTGTAAKAKSSDSAMGPDAFMKLLVAQLKYQNPMAPTDGQAYMTQMATFTQVEKLDQLVKAQADAVQWQQRVSAEGLVGRSVTGTTDGKISTGTVVGVRYAAGSALLELSDGTTLAPGDVERVQQAGAAAPTAAPATTAPSSSSSTSPGTTPSSTTSTEPSTGPTSTQPTSTEPTSTEPSTTSTPSA